MNMWTMNEWMYVCTIYAWMNESINNEWMYEQWMNDFIMN